MNNPSAPRKLLIVDDDRLFCDLVKEDLSNPTLEVVIANHVTEAAKVFRAQKFDVILLDNNLPDGNGLDLIPDILRFNEQTKIILITAFPSYDNAVAALKNGVFDYLPKPLDIDELQVTVERALRTAALEQVEQIERYKAGQESAASVLLGAGAEFEELQKLIEKAARSTAPVLITGDTGTGKNVVAQAIHYRADSSRKTFVSVNCAALPENLIEAELFGAEKGAYTGAVTTRKGIFEIADGGTLFLDEIGEMPFALQAKLLSVLEDGKVRRIGGDATRSVNVRIIAATNAEMEQAISEKRFRSDLFYRLSVIRIHLRPLRERKQDIPALCRMFISKFAPGRDIHLPDEELELITKYDYPGNVRELRNIIERCVILQEGNTIHPSKLIFTDENTSSISSSVSFTDTDSASDKNNIDETVLTLEEVERNHIITTLAKFSNNFSQSAKALNISLSTLKRKLREYGIR